MKPKRNLKNVLMSRRALLAGGASLAAVGPFVIVPGRASSTMTQSWPGSRRRRVSQPSPMSRPRPGASSACGGP